MRLFLALHVPQEISDGLVDLLDHTDISRIRIVGRDLWHVNLAFLGDVPETDVDLIVNACKKFSRCPGSIMIDRLETFPSGGPRLLVGLGKETPREAWKTFIEELRGEMLSFTPAIDQKPWRPHITVGRGPKEAVLPKWGVDAGPWTWKPSGFTLMESMLSEEGPQYRILHEFSFVV